MFNSNRNTACSRRAFLRASASAAISASLPALSKSQGLIVPQVDTLTLQIVVDNATFGPFLPNQTFPGLRVVRNASGTGGWTMSRTPLMAEFGLSVLAESRLASSSKMVMVDFGYSPEVIRSNITVLGIDASRIDAAVLSHGHLDHYGGFAGVFADSKSKGKRVPLVVGGEETFCERVAMIGTPPPVMGSLDRERLKEAGFDVRIAPDPVVMAGHALTTGRIPMTGFERAAIPTQMRPGVGCNASELSEAKRQLTIVPDDGEHEVATFYNVKDLGLVVIASCSHRGVINSVRRAQAISGVSRVHMVIGGFHLVSPRTKEEAHRTVTELAAMDPAYIVPMHCTGEDFIGEALRVMPQKIIRPYVGTKLIVENA